MIDVTTFAAAEWQPDGDGDGGCRGVARYAPRHDDSAACGRSTDDALALERPERVDHAPRLVGASGELSTVTDVRGDETCGSGEREHPDGEDDDRDEELDDGEAVAHAREDAWCRARYGIVRLHAASLRSGAARGTGCTKGGGQRPPPFTISVAERRSIRQLHFGSASTVAGPTAATPMKIAQVRVVALCAEVALQPVPPVFAATTWTPADGTKPDRDAVVPPWLVAVPLV